MSPIVIGIIGILVLFVLLAMRMQIDKTGRDDKAGCVDFPFAIHPIAANGSNPPVSDTYISHCVQTRVRVHHVAVPHDQFVSLRWAAS